MEEKEKELDPFEDDGWSVEDPIPGLEMAELTLRSVKIDENGNIVETQETVLLPKTPEEQIGEK